MREASGIGVPVIVSVFAYTPQEFAAVAEQVVKIGAGGVELNVSCPHAEKTGAEIGQDLRLVEEVVKAVKRKVEKPVFVKLTPNVASIAEVARAAEKGGADGVTTINTVKAMVIDVETAKPILGNKVGGLSGPAIKPIAVRCVYDVYETVKVPVIGCGGINSWRDAVEFIHAGASAIQIGTAIAFRGLEVFKHVTEGIDAFLRKKRIGSVKEIVGSSHRN
jgi:dihydroorotate dehydrogenase (NAD+) catalytic subunit